jgi:DNA-binding PadR family transcriptional regulator
MFRHVAFAGTGPACGPGERASYRGVDLAMMWRAMAEARHGAGGGGRGGRHGGHGRHGVFGPRGGFPFGPPFGGPGGGGPGGFPGGRRGPKARRGDVRTAALLLLAEEPRNGYGIMQELEQRSGGTWRPSPGSVYPALQQLEDEGLVRSEEVDGRKLFALTDAGRAYVAERGEDQPAPWEEMAGGVSDESWALMNTMREVGFALFQVMQTGSETQRTEARRILAATRRDLYRLLADGDDADDAAGESGSEGPYEA